MADPPLTKTMDVSIPAIRSALTKSDRVKTKIKRIEEIIAEEPKKLYLDFLNEAKDEILEEFIGFMPLNISSIKEENFVKGCKQHFAEGIGAPGYIYPIFGHEDTGLCVSQRADTVFTVNEEEMDYWILVCAVAFDTNGVKKARHYTQEQSTPRAMKWNEDIFLEGEPSGWKRHFECIQNIVYVGDISPIDGLYPRNVYPLAIAKVQFRRKNLSSLENLDIVEKHPGMVRGNLRFRIENVTSGKDDERRVIVEELLVVGVEIHSRYKIEINKWPENLYFDSFLPLSHVFNSWIVNGKLSMEQLLYRGNVKMLTNFFYDHTSRSCSKPHDLHVYLNYYEVEPPFEEKNKVIKRMLDLENRRMILFGCFPLFAQSGHSICAVVPAGETANRLGLPQISAGRFHLIQALPSSKSVHSYIDRNNELDIQFSTPPYAKTDGIDYQCWAPPSPELIDLVSSDEEIEAYENTKIEDIEDRSTICVATDIQSTTDQNDIHSVQQSTTRYSEEMSPISPMYPPTISSNPSNSPLVSTSSDVFPPLSLSIPDIPLPIDSIPLPTSRQLFPPSLPSYPPRIPPVSSFQSLPTPYTRFSSYIFPNPHSSSSASSSSMENNREPRERRLSRWDRDTLFEVQPTVIEKTQEIIPCEKRRREEDNYDTNDMEIEERDERSEEGNRRKIRKEQNFGLDFGDEDEEEEMEASRVEGEQIHGEERYHVNKEKSPVVKEKSPAKEIESIDRRRLSSSVYGDDEEEEEEVVVKKVIPLSPPPDDPSIREGFRKMKVSAARHALNARTIPSDTPTSEDMVASLSPPPPDSQSDTSNRENTCVQREFVLWNRKKHGEEKKSFDRLPSSAVIIVIDDQMVKQIKIDEWNGLIKMMNDRLNDMLNKTIVVLHEDIDPDLPSSPKQLRLIDPSIVFIMDHNRENSLIEQIECCDRVRKMGNEDTEMIYLTPNITLDLVKNYDLSKLGFKIFNVSGVIDHMTTRQYEQDDY